MNGKWFPRALISIAALLAVGAQALAAAPTESLKESGKPANPEDDPAFPKPAADADRYLLGAGDMIQVFVWRNEELSATVPVLPDGTISTPLVDGIAASGKTPVQLARAVEEALSEYVRSPRVSVLVSVPKSSNSQIKLVGGGIKNTTLPYEVGMTVMDAVMAAGGLGTYARGNASEIIRKEETKHKKIPVRIKDLMKGEVKHDLPLQPGDIINVPETLF